MPRIHSFIKLAAATAFVFSGWAVSANNTVTDTQNTSATSQDMKHKVKSASVSFQPGQTTLAESEKKTLRDMVSKMKTRGEIEGAKVAVWSDKPYPAEGELSDADQELASNRIETIETFLEDELELSDVDTFNMADRANWIARLFNTEEAELDAAFAQRGSDAEVTEKEFREIKAHGGASKAVVVFAKEKMMKKDQPAE